MQFEERIIDPILNLIKDHQVYLTQPENLPQLAKLGYMYNTLWYAGRHASYHGAIEKKIYTEDDGETWECEQCDDNPKYKIDMCEPENQEIEDYIYDAWGMHIIDDFGPEWNEFSTIVLQGRALTELEAKMLKPNKTFEEWVEILTDEEYQYSGLYPNRRSVACSLLCGIGNDYGYKDGYIILEASGADQDSTDYGDWMNAKFREDIQIVVDQIMADPEVEKVMLFVGEAGKKHKEEKLAEEIKSFGMPYKEWLKSDKHKDFSKKLAELRGETIEEEEEPYNTYYPICQYSAITQIDENSHPSYINAAIEICEDIIAHREIELKDRKGNVLFAEKFLKKAKNNFVEEFEEKVITEEELKVKIQQLKSSFTVSGEVLIKSDRFINEAHFNEVKKNEKVWTDEEIGQQITTLIKQKSVSEYVLQKFIKEYKPQIEYKDYKKEFKVFKKALYELVGWDKLTPLDGKFWKNFGSAPYTMSHGHKNIGELHKSYGAVGMEDIFDDAFEMGYHLCYDISNALYYFKQEWVEQKE